MPAGRVVKLTLSLLLTLEATSGSRAFAGDSTGRVAQTHNRFGFKLFSELCSLGPPDNVLVSPSSIAFALGVVYNGARGQTAEEMARCLELQGLDPDVVNRGDADLLRSLRSQGKDVELQVATSLWAERSVTFRPAFLRQAESSVQARVTQLNLSTAGAVSRINTWVREMTHGKIDGIVERLDPEDVLVIVNAVYFHAPWAEEFDAKATRDKGFTLLDGSIVPRPMMSRTGTFPYFKGAHFQEAALPYSGNMMSFHVILPDSGSTLSEVVDTLSHETWNIWQLQPTRGYVELPRFEMSYDLMMNEALVALGMKIAFTEAADFGVMADVHPLFISEVRHKCRMQVHERGTQAAAATEVRMTQGAAVEPSTAPFTMIVDRPFLCAIRDRITGLVLFLGVVTEPQPL